MEGGLIKKSLWRGTSYLHPAAKLTIQQTFRVQVYLFFLFLKKNFHSTPPLVISPFMLLFVANHSNPPATATPIIFSKSNKSGTESAQRQPASHTLQTTKDSLMLCWGQYASFRSLQLPSSPHDTHCRI